MGPKKFVSWTLKSWLTSILFNSFSIFLILKMRH
jgi:hypothetical protein